MKKSIIQKAETISKLTVNSQILQHHLNYPNLDRVTEIRSQYSTPSQEQKRTLLTFYVV